MFLLTMLYAFRYLVCCAPCIISNSQAFSYLNFFLIGMNFLETADQCGSDNWCSTVAANVLYMLHIINKTEHFSCFKN